MHAARRWHAYETADQVRFGSDRDSQEWGALQLPRVGKYRSDGSVSAAFATCCSTLASHINDGELILAGTCVESFGCLRLPCKPELNHLIPALTAFHFHFLPRRAPALCSSPSPLFPHALSRSISACPSSLPISPPPVRVRRRQRVPGPVLVSPSRPCDRRPSHPIFSPVLCSLHPEPGLPCHKASRTRAILALSACAPEVRARVLSRRSAPFALLTGLRRPCLRPFFTRPNAPPLRPNMPHPPRAPSSRPPLPPPPPRPISLRGALLALELCVLSAAISHGPPLSLSFSSLLHSCIRSSLPSFLLFLRLPASCALYWIYPRHHTISIQRSIPAPSSSHPGVHPSVRAHLRDEVSAPAPHALIIPLRPSFWSSSSSRRRRPAAHAGFLLLFAICDLLCTARSLNAAYLSTARRPEIPPQTQTKRNSTAAFPAVRIPIPDALPTRPVCVPALVSHRNIRGLPIRT
ncbi:hypothetical protein DFH09DRAFT_1353913 [Mycena vulgaris]|nr:hypothetical protein DFH09DRAFT_1353913 [Mycena vulgaris]